jgi:hypothetical protein
MERVFYVIGNNVLLHKNAPQDAHSRVWYFVGYADRARRESFASETLCSIYE